MAQTGHHPDRGSGRNGNVVFMNRFRNGRPLSPLHQAEAYWSALRREGDIPWRNEIDPRGLEPVLRHVFILERTAPDQAQFRVAGQQVNNLAGVDLRRMPLAALFAARHRAAVGALLRDVFAMPAVGDLVLTAGGADDTGNPGGGTLEARMMLLPLRSDSGEVGRALGILLSDQDMPATPRRFELLRAEARPVSGRSAEVLCGGIRRGEGQAPMPENASYLRLVPSHDSR